MSQYPRSTVHFLIDSSLVVTVLILIDSPVSFRRSPRPGPALADQRHRGVRVGERDCPAAERAEGNLGGAPHDGKLLFTLSAVF